MYHVPAEISCMLGTYFDGFRMLFTTKDFTTNWTRLEVRIAMGYTVSPVLFVLSMQLLLKATESKSNFVEFG